MREQSGAEVGLEISEHVATITLQAPERRNSLTPSMAEELIEVCEEVDRDPEVGAVVVLGAGGYFCAGAHRDTLAQAGKDPALPEAYGAIGSIYRSFTRVGEVEPPVIAAVRGGAVGAGVNLFFACDLRVVSEEARIVSGFLGLGLHPGGGHFALVGRAAGRETAAAMGLFGEELSGRRAFELGTAWDAVPDQEVEGRALELARRAGKDPELARRAAQSFRLELSPPGLPWPVAVDFERSSQMWSMRRKQA